MRKTRFLAFLSCFDVDWTGNTDNRRSISGICFRLNKSSGAYSWVHKGHKSVKTSTAEAECIILIEESTECPGVKCPGVKLH